MSRLLLELQLARVDERIRMHEQGRPAFPKPAWYDVRTFLAQLRSTTANKLAFNQNIPTAPPNLWDKIVVGLAEWALRPRIKKEDQATPPYEA